MQPLLETISLETFRRDGCHFFLTTGDGNEGVVLNPDAAAASPLLASLLDGLVNGDADTADTVVTVPNTTLPALRIAATYVTAISDPDLDPQELPKAEFLPRPLGTIKGIPDTALAPVEVSVLRHCKAVSIAKRDCGSMGHAFLASVNDSLVSVLNAADFLRVTSLATFAGALLAIQALDSPKSHDLSDTSWRHDPATPPAFVEATELNPKAVERCTAVAALTQLQRRRFVDPFVPGTPIHIVANGVEDFQALYSEIRSVAARNYAVQEIKGIVIPRKFVDAARGPSFPSSFTHFEDIAGLFNGKHPSAPAVLLRPHLFPASHHTAPPASTDRDETSTNTASTVDSSSEGTPSEGSSEASESILETIEYDCRQCVYSLPKPLTVAAQAISSSAQRLLEFPFVCGTSGGDAGPALSAEGHALGLETLRPLCVAAPFGRGSETVVDAAVRRTLEATPPSVDVQWPGLDAALQRTALTLCPWHVDPSTGRHTLEASLYKVLLYSPGDMFKAHYDTKRCPGHELTLVVDLGLRDAGDCSGGDVVFSSHYEHVEGRRWHSVDRGDWCAWWATERHAVSELKSGNRVVATYNITVPDRGVGDVTDLTKQILPFPSPLNVYREEDNEAEGTLCSAAARAASRPQMTVSSTDAAVAAMESALASELGTLVEQARQIGVPFVGVVCRNMYSFDGRHTAPLSVLRGVDRTVAALFARHGVKAACLTKVHRLNEFPSDDASRRRLKPSVAARAAEVGRGLEDLSEQMAQRYEPRGAHVVLSTGGPEMTFDTVFELDQGLRHTPAVGTMWLDALPQVHIPQGRCVADMLWGNASTFSVYSYARVALVFDIAPDTEPSKLFPTSERSAWW